MPKPERTIPFEICLLNPVIVKTTITSAHIFQGLEAEHVEVKDMSDGCGGKFDAVVVSAKFEGKVRMVLFIIRNFKILK